MQIPIDWLLEGEPWIEYRTRRDLLGQGEKHPQVSSARAAILEHERIQNLLLELSDWPGKVISSHKSAGQPFQKLTFIADLGLVANDPGVEPIIRRILRQQSVEGPFPLPINTSCHYAGTGQDQWAWALCDAPLIIYLCIGQVWTRGSASDTKGSSV